MTCCSLVSVDGGGATGAAIAGGLSWRLTKRRAAAVVRVMHVDLRRRKGVDFWRGVIGFCDLEEEALIGVCLKEEFGRISGLKGGKCWVFREGKVKWL